MSDDLVQTEAGRRELLVMARELEVNLVALGTAQPDGSVTLDWDRLAEDVREKCAERGHPLVGSSCRCGGNHL